jgi:hypothetical protein
MTENFSNLLGKNGHFGKKLRFFGGHHQDLLSKNCSFRCKFSMFFSKLHQNLGRNLIKFMKD